MDYLALARRAGQGHEGAHGRSTHAAGRQSDAVRRQAHDLRRLCASRGKMTGGWHECRVQPHHRLVQRQQGLGNVPCQHAGPPGPEEMGTLQVVTTANGVNVDFMDKEGQIRTQHYAFLVSEVEFDQIFGRVKERGLTHWADPAQAKAGEINRHDGGRGVYFEDPSGHLLKIITRPKIWSNSASL